MCVQWYLDLYVGSFNECCLNELCFVTDFKALFIT